MHFEDQLAAEKKCGHLGGKVLIPTGQHIRTLNAARLAADVMRVTTLIVARPDAASAQLITSEIDERDLPIPDRGVDGGDARDEPAHRVGRAAAPNGKLVVHGEPGGIGPRCERVVAAGGGRIPPCSPPERQAEPDTSAKLVHPRLASSPEGD